MRIFYIAGREESYSRTRNVLKGLRENDVEVIPCFPPNKSFKNYPRLLAYYLFKEKNYDLILVGFYGQLLLPFVKIFARRKIIFDMYIATYDTMVHDRGAAKPGSLLAKFFYLADRFSCRLSDKIILETHDHIRDFSKKFKIDRGRFERIFLATDNTIIYPRNVKKDTERFLVHFHGEYAPFHGVQYIIKAAHLLRDEDIEFQLIGRGITYERDRRLAQELGVRNIRFIDPVPFEELAEYISKADVCLGIFGDNERTLRVTTNKVIEAIAVGKPLISGRNEPIQELLADGKSVLLCERANPESLAQAILKLKEDEALRNKIAQQGYQIFLKYCTCQVLGKGFKKIAEELIADGKAN